MTCKVIADKNKPIKILDCETNNVFSLENKEEALKFCDALNVTLNYVNELIDAKVELKKENEKLKQEKDKWKQQCIHFKEMLDDMDIAYLCDEWIYEELKGDFE